MKVTRLLVYEGDEEWLLKQLAGSLPEGVKELNSEEPWRACSITVLTLDDVQLKAALQERMMRTWALME